MRREKTYRVAHRRRREERTDYRQRLRLLKSRKPRLVVRRLSNSVVCQLIAYDHAGDRVVAAARSGELASYGWRGHTGNLPAAYLTGYLCGVRARQKKIIEAVTDLGLQESTKASGLYAAVKGALDAGLQIPHEDGILPTEERFSGRHIADFAAGLKKENVSEYEKRFSQYATNKLSPEDLPKHVAEVRAKISTGK